MQSYSVQDVERVLGLSRSTIKGLIDGGFVTPARGPRRQYRFSFQDLIVLRTARALTQANVPARRVRRALDELRQHLPETVPLSGLSIRAVGERVVVRDGAAQWQVDDGQYVLALDVDVDAGQLRVVERKDPTPSEPPAESWFERALELESSDPGAARDAYEHAVGDDPGNAAAWANLGRLLHEQGRMGDASCSRTCAARPRRSRRISRPSARIPASLTATTTSRVCTRRSASRSTRSAT
jgi:DNA-binding transcriptional MerR regulator